MIKMVIKMDNNKIKHMGQYTIDQINMAIDRISCGKGDGEGPDC